MENLNKRMCCIFCGIKATLACEICQEFYCSAECQDKDWRYHKYFCSPKPKLVRIASGEKNEGVHHVPKNRAGMDESKEKPSLVATKEDAVEKAGILPTFWQTSLQPSSNCIEAFIHSMESNSNATKVWVTENENMPKLQRFMEDVTESFGNARNLRMENINIGALVALFHGNEYYRAKVLDTNAENENIFIRLLDFGNTVCSPLHKLYPPSCIMFSKPAFAFQVHFPIVLNPNLLKTSIKIIILESFGDDFYKGELIPKSSGPSLPIKALLKNPFIKFVKIISDDGMALMHLHSFDELEGFQDTMIEYHKDETASFKNSLFMGSYLAALFENKWIRCRLICTLDNENIGIVYDLDNGSIVKAKNFKKIPQKYLSIPAQAFAIKINTKELPKLRDAKKKFGLILPRECDTSSKTIEAILSIDDKQKYTTHVKLLQFSGNSRELKSNYYKMDVMPDQLVNITHVKNFHDIYVSPTFTQNYAKYFNEVATESPPCQMCTLRKGDILLYTKNGKTFKRVEVVKLPDDSNSSLVLFAIDIGEQFTYDQITDELRKPHFSIFFAPSFLRRIHFKLLQQLPCPYINNKALLYLFEKKNNKDPFKLVINKNEYHLINENEEQLTDILVPLVFKPLTPEQNPCKEKTPQPVSLATSPMLLTQPNIPRNPLQTNNARQLEVEQDKYRPEETPAAAAAGSSISNSNKNVVNGESISETMKELSITPTNTRATNPSQPPLVPSLAKTKLMLEDLPVIPLKTGKGVAIKILDVSAIEKGFITASDPDNKNAAFEMERKNEQLNKYCETVGAIHRGYEPSAGELCVAIFDEDSKWYRALCIGVNENKKFDVMYVDFGNSSEVSSKDIFPFREEFLYPSIANSCYIADFDPNTSINALIQAVNHEIATLTCDVEMLNDGIYSIKLSSL